MVETASPIGSSERGGRPTERCRDRASRLRRRAWIAAFTWMLAGSLSAADVVESPLGPRSVPAGATMFTRLDPAQTGIVTQNNYADPAMWTEHYQELAFGTMGTGVAIGDYDNDGRPDVFVVSKTEACRLFRNLGDWKFNDTTAAAGLDPAAGGWLASVKGWFGLGPALGDNVGAWKQGATFADVNNDGWLDLYVCRFNAPNWLFVNQRDGTFKEEAEARGLAIVDGSGVGAFCDYDRDGWLDVYVQTNMSDVAQHPHGQRDHLLHNRGDGTYEDVTDRAGVGGETSGHSATWWDHDGDGWPDLYVADDFTVPDSLYHNNRDGTFTNVIGQVVPHTPYYAMGADLGDVNNDGRIDLFVADMAPSTHEKDQRGMAGSRSRAQVYDERTPAPQYMRNALYLNTGTGPLREAAWLAGIARTDWTWSPRWEDLDNDGWLDLFVTNGMIREYHNADMLARIMGFEDLMQQRRTVRASPVMAEANFAFRNLGNLQFEDDSAAWGLDQKGVSFGAAFGDLDDDGDLDVVFGNYEAGATVLRNDSRDGHRVIVALRGTRSNRFGIGALVRIVSASGIQVRPLVCARGYLSSSEPVAHFGLGSDDHIQRLTILWPSGSVQTYDDLDVDRRYTITEPTAGAPSGDMAGGGEAGRASAKPATGGPLFVKVDDVPGLDLTMAKPTAGPVGTQALLPLRLDQVGREVALGGLDVSASPTLSIPANTGAAVAADFDHDGYLDVFLGARYVPGKYPLSPRSSLLANRGDRFEDVTDTLAPGLREMGMVTAALWSDVDGDGWIDLLVALDWGGLRYWHNRAGHGFEDRSHAAGFDSAGTGWWTALATADFNGDGRPDYVAGNVGLNTQYHASAEHPALLFYGDFHGVGTAQLVEAYFEGDRLYPWRTRNDLGKQIPSILRRFPRNDDYAKAMLDEIVGPERLAAARRFAATELRSGVLLSQADGSYHFAPLPRIAQIAPLSGIVAADFDGDGRADIVAVQNSYAPIQPVGRFDGGVGQFLRGDGQGNFTPVPPAQSGFVVPGEGRELEALDFDNNGWPDLVAARGAGAPSLAFRNAGVPGRRALRVKLQGTSDNQAAIGARVTLELGDGSSQTSEIVAAPGRDAPSAASCFFGYPETNPPRRVRVRWATGEETERDLNHDAEPVLVIHRQ